MSQKSNKSTQQSDDEAQLMEEIVGNSEEDTSAEIAVSDSDLVSDQYEDDSREELIEKLLIANTEIEEMKAGYIRAKADVENIQRRSRNEMISARKFAIEGFARELLSVIDSLEQASRVEMDKSNAEAVDKMKEGLALTLKQFDTVMEKFGVTAVEAEAGVKFNPEWHQAISMVPSEDVDPEHILSVMQKGFMLKDRLLRPAMVVIATSAES
jgi:molecular chaperone GrpE